MPMSILSTNRESALQAAAGITTSLLICSSALGVVNRLPDGSGFETGPDGWDVMPHRPIQDPVAPSTSYPRGWRIGVAPADTTVEGNFSLVLEGGPTLQYHDVRWGPVELEPNTDYTFSAYLKVESDYYAGGCEAAGFGSFFNVTNGPGIAISPKMIRDQDSDLRTCFERIYFHFNTGDIAEESRHPQDKYGFRLTIDTTKLGATDSTDYRIYIDAAQVSIGATARSYIPPKVHDIGIDVIPAGDDDQVSERALRHYKLFEESEPIELRYWVYTRPGSPRPQRVGLRVEDAYLRDEESAPLILVPGFPIADPGVGGTGTITIDQADLEGGSGTYRVLVGAPLDGEWEEFVFGVLRPPHPDANVPADDHQFGVQLGNFKYLHRLINQDGDPSNDRPECEQAENGDPECTTRVLYADGPDPNLPLWMIERLGIPHLRIKHVFHPKGYAPTDSIDGTWDLTYVDRFVDTVNQYDLNILAMTGDVLHKVEDFSAQTVTGYPVWMNADSSGWQAFLDGNERMYQELAATLGDRVHAYEVFNEPTAIRNSIQPADLAQLDQVASDVIANAGLDVKVVGFGLTGLGPRGVNAAPDFPQGRDALVGEFISMGGLETMDVAAMHVAVTQEIDVYPDSLYNHGLEMRLAYCSRALKTELKRLIEARDPDNIGFPFWVTETSYLSGSVYPKFDIPGATDIGLLGRRVDSHRETARLVAQEFVTLLSSGWERAYYFNFDATLFIGVNVGVFRTLVDVYGSPRTALGAFYNLSQNLAGARFVGKFEKAHSKRVFVKFERGDDDIIVLYSLDPNTVDIPFHIQEPSIYVDMWGAQVEDPVLSPDPIYIHGPELDLNSVAGQIEEQAAKFDDLAVKGEDDEPTLRFDRIPRTGKHEWDFECAAHLWLAHEPNPEDLTGRTIDYVQRFTDGINRQMVPEGEFFQGYADEINGVSTSVHSGETVFTGSRLLAHSDSFTEKVAVVEGDVEQYLVISERGSAQFGVYLIGYSDPAISQDPRYRLLDLDPGFIDPIEKRINIPPHEVDLIEVLEEGGFFVDPSEEYLLDIVTFAVGDGAVFGIDDVRYFDDMAAPGRRGLSSDISP